MNTFLTAEWRKLILANYTVPEEILEPYLPANTELDIWNGRCYVSLVGFMFLNTRVKGIGFPFHRDFEEMNLRFYVNYLDSESGRKRAAVFIGEIVPKHAITLVAKSIYKEPYTTLPMKHSWKGDQDFIEVEYACYSNHWNRMRVKALNAPAPFVSGSEEEFITEHYWGCTKHSAIKTKEYEVKHPCWQMYPVTDYFCDCDFGNLYGKEFSFLNHQSPNSVFLAEGSEISVKSGRTLVPQLIKY